MLINTRERLTTLFDAQREYDEIRASSVSDGFYDQKMGKLWERAAESPAYRGFGPYSWQAFTELPVTAKTRLRAEPWHFVATGLESSAKYYETTGTTGTGTPTPRLADDVIWNVVSVASAWRELLSKDERALSLLPSDIVPVGDLVASVCEYLDVPHARAYPFATGISDWERVIGLWRTLRPTVVFMAPGVALQLTRLLQQRGLLAELSGSVRTINLLGEVSVPAMRARLGAWWGARVFDSSYGSTETGTLAAACSMDRLHLLAASNYAEVETSHGLTPLEHGSRGKLVVTPLNLYSRPLLRYDTGDEVVASADCPCGANELSITVLGRATDGVQVHGAVLSPHVVEDIIYGLTPATGYVLDVDPEGGRFRLVLERFPGQDRKQEPSWLTAVQEAFRTQVPPGCDGATFVNTLPSTTKSGASQKSWKRSNIRVLKE